MRDGFHASGETPRRRHRRLLPAAHARRLSPGAERRGDARCCVRPFSLSCPYRKRSSGSRRGAPAVEDDRRGKLGRLEGLGLIDRLLWRRSGKRSLHGQRPGATAVRSLAVPPTSRHVARATVTPLADAWRDADGDLPYGPWSLELLRGSPDCRRYPAAPYRRGERLVDAGCSETKHDAKRGTRRRAETRHRRHRPTA